MKKKAFWTCLLLLLAVLTAPSVFASKETESTSAAESETEAEFVEIYTAEELQAMAENPKGSYILMSDLDMAGVEWKPVDFCGTFDGNGHAILNLTLSKPGDEITDTYDGNRKAYDTTFVGLFGTLRNATVTGVKLINVRALIDTDEPCFLAGIAGYMKGSVISDCTVTGNLELRAFDRMFGIGGVAGYGGGTIERCKVDVTLICTDTDSTTRDEEFLGGVYATGFINVKNCQVTIDGYCSEFGYVHNGGIVGMYMQQPMGKGISGRITGNSVTGEITFFECNTDRRAYCAPYAGEVLAKRYLITKNTNDFKRDERKDYSVELRPEMCDAPSYTETVVPAGCDTYGYTSYCCDTCGYTYTDHYTLFQHSVTTWSVKVAPTTEAEGLSVGYCDGCGLEFQQVVEKLEPVPVKAPSFWSQNKVILIIAASATAVILTVIIVICLLRGKNKRKGKK